MGYKKRYECGECGEKYTIKGIEKAGIFKMEPFGNFIWRCPNCESANGFFNEEMSYMPKITVIHEDGSQSEFNPPWAVEYK